VPDGDAANPDECSKIPTPCGNVQYVDSTIGSGEIGYRLGAVFVGAAAPHGFAKVGPDTSSDVNGKAALFHAVGYWYPDNHIDGFVHVHAHGIGVVDYGDILLQPTIGMDEKKTTPDGYRAKFDHADETAVPGYYRTLMSNGKLDVAVTATHRAAVHGIKFPQSKFATMILDASYTLPSCSCDGAAVHIDPEKNIVSGYKKAKCDLSGRFGGYTVYFWAEFSRAPKEWGTFAPGELFPGILDREEEKAGAYATFDTTEDQEIEVRIGLSFVDLDGARDNFEKEVAGRSFEDVYAGTAKLWEESLSTIEIDTTDPEERTAFYTALYHTMLMPTVFSDQDGRYVGMDKEVHTADWGDYYTDFSMWDTYRTVHPLYILLFPERQTDMLRSLVKMKEQGGFLPKWPIACGEAGCMIGTPADVIVADSYLKGLHDFDYEVAYDSMVKVANGPDAESGYSGRPAALDYIALGYVPQDKEGGSVSKTQEYGYADYCISRMAAALGHAEDAEEFRKRSGFFKNLWFDEEGFFRARNSDGSWYEPFNPLVWQDPYTEGNAWQYLWYPPNDVPGSAKLLGGWTPFLVRLEEFFQLSMDNWNDVIPSPYYFHGNEPDIQAPFYFSLSGDPDSTTRWSDWVAAKNYSNTAAGLAGNDDAGTLSAWYVFAAIGAYPFPCMDTYALLRPRFDKITLKSPVLDLSVTRGGEGAVIESVEVDGEPIDTGWLTHAQLVGASNIHFKMGEKPATWKKWEDPDAP